MIITGDLNAKLGTKTNKKKTPKAYGIGERDTKGIA